jgi:aspartate carbamoyltransferase catalytic subunit
LGLEQNLGDYGLNSLFGMKNVSKEEIIKILDKAENFKQEFLAGRRDFGNLNGKTVCMLFFENSTRTRNSFEAATKYLGGKVLNVSLANSSVNKGESLVDTIRTLDAMKIDAIVTRHQMSGFPQFISKYTSAKIVNAGDGINEHPTQALLDLLTMREKFGSFEGLNVLIVGDVYHSRVVRSNLFALNRLGANVSVCGPTTLIPPFMEQLGAKVYYNLDEALADADVVMGLRIQLERQKGGLFPSLSEYSKLYRLDDRRMKLAKPGAIFMHPGPANRNLEVTPEVADSELSCKDLQVTNGVFARMAVLDTLLN